MAGSTVVCEGCGAVCNTEDGYCKSCWKKLPCESEDNDGVLEGIGHSDWNEFIEKNKDYYMPIFQKNEGKKFFIRMNWSAFFLRFNWLFYRKMYKVAVICYALTFAAIALFALLFSIPYSAEIQALQDPILAYEDYIDKGGDTTLYTASGDPYKPAVVTNGREAKDRVSEIRLEICLKSMLTAFVLQPLIMGVFGNAIYKAHIKKHIYDPNGGGASITSLIFGWLLFDIIEAILSYGFVLLALLWIVV